MTFERIIRPDIPHWVKVSLSDEVIRLQGRHRTPVRDGLYTVLFWIASLGALLALGLAIALRSIPFGLTPTAALFWLIIIALAFRFVFAHPLRLLMGSTMRVEFTRDGRIRVPGRFGGGMTDHRPADTYQVAFGVIEPEHLKRVNQSRHQKGLIEWQRRLWANAGTLEFRFGADLIPLATFSRRRSAEEFVAVCNWARDQIRSLSVAEGAPMHAI